MSAVFRYRRSAVGLVIAMLAATCVAVLVTPRPALAASSDCDTAGNQCKAPNCGGDAGQVPYCGEVLQRHDRPGPA